MVSKQVKKITMKKPVATKKAATKKAATKKVATKKIATKKVAAKKAITKKKVITKKKKAAPKKSAPKKPPAKKKVITKKKKAAPRKVKAEPKDPAQEREEARPLKKSNGKLRERIVCKTLDQFYKIAVDEFRTVKYLELYFSDKELEVAFDLQHRMPKLTDLKISGGFRTLQLNDELTPKLEYLEVEGGYPKGFDFWVECSKLKHINMKFIQDFSNESIWNMLMAARQLEVFESYKVWFQTIGLKFFSPPPPVINFQSLIVLILALIDTSFPIPQIVLN